VKSVTIYVPTHFKVKDDANIDKFDTLLDFFWVSIGLLIYQADYYYVSYKGSEVYSTGHHQPENYRCLTEKFGFFTFGQRHHKSYS